MSPTGLSAVLAAHGAAWALGSLLKGTLLLVAVFGAAAVLRRASAGVRHLVWSAGLGAVVLLPVVSLVLPWSLPVVRLPAPPAAAVVRASAQELATPGTSGTPATAAVGVPAAAAPAQAAPSGLGRWTLPHLSLVEWVLWIWAAGALVVLLRLGRGALLVRRVVHGADALATPDWTRPLVEAADRMGLSREPRLLTSGSVLMPVVCGVLRPTLVLPVGAAEWTERRRRAVLCHELAHVRRNDLGLTLLSRLGCAMYWFHPLVWVAARRLRLESERACDDLVLAVGTRPSEYADHLLQIACGAGRMRSPAFALPMAERREFEGRMLAILEKDAHRGAPSGRQAGLLAALGVAVLLPLAAMGMARAPQPDGVPPGEASRIPAADAPRSGAREAVATTPSHATTARTGTATPQGTAASRHAAITGLNDVAAGVRASAAISLGQADDTAAVAALARLLGSDPNEQVRVAAAEALGRMEAKSGTAALGAALGDQSAAVRRTAAWALGQIEDKSSVAALARALADRDSSVRETVAWALGQIEGADAVPALAETLARDDRVEVRRKAAWALGQIEDKSAVGPLGTALGADRDAEVRRTAAWALGQIGDGAGGTALAAALRDTSDDVRMVAVWALGQVGLRRAPEALLRSLGRDTPAIREKAAWALGQIGDAAAVPALAAALADSSADVRRTALWALGQLDDDAARTALVGALKSADPDLRAAAARALGGGRAEPRPEPMPMPQPRPSPDDND